jgi:hypothetical protein
MVALLNYFFQDNRAIDLRTIKDGLSSLPHSLDDFGAWY